METVFVVGAVSTWGTSGDLTEPGSGDSGLALVGVREVQGAGAARPREEKRGKKRNVEKQVVCLTQAGLET